MSESDYRDIVFSHYNKSQVQNEITEFSRYRWVAVHCEFLNPQGYPILLRYQRGTGKGKMPLTISKCEDVPALLKRFERLKPRTFYASASVYRDLTREEHVRDLDNIMFCDPTWDIDNTLDKWRATIEVAKEIITFLREEGVSRSVFFKWSGKGAHVHLHHRAFSPTLLRKISPLNIAYAVVEYVNQALRTRFTEIASKHKANDLAVENEIDSQRVFTCPLSLHRSLNYVAVCISPTSIDDFTPEWTKVEGYRHWQDWNQFDVGEADKLADKAYQLVGAYTGRISSKTKRRKTTSPITKWLK